MLLFMLRRTLCLWAILLLAGCSSGMQTYASFDRKVAFENFTTFGFAGMEEPKPEGAYLSLSEKYLQQAVRKELVARGLSEAKEPQLLIAFNSVSKEKIAQVPSLTTDVHQYVDVFGRVRTVSIAGEPQVVQYTEGTLTIDVIDANQKAALWQGVAVGRKTIPKDNSLEDDINAVVAKIFAKYPLPKPVVQP